MAIIPSDEEREADNMRLRISSFSFTKTDRAVEKGIITKEDAEKVQKDIDKLLYKFNDDWWIDRKGHKSFETMLLMFTSADGDFTKDIEILQKIEKA